MAALRILLLTFISRFVIDFLSIRKVIIFSAIATEGGTENLLHTLSRNDVRRLTSRSNGMPSNKIMLLRTFVVVETVLRRGRIFQCSDEV